MIKNLISYLVHQLVDKPEKVLVTEVEMPDKYLIEVRVASQDLARIIGIEGRTFRALRAMVTLLNPGKNADLVVDIAE